MNYKEASKIISRQEKNVGKINGERFVYNGYEYKVTFYGGFGSYVALDRRQVGKRNFKFFPGISAAHCATAEQAMKLIMEHVQRKG